jgi:hypothetical protein
VIVPRKIIALSGLLWKQGGPAEAALRAKCNWERMTRCAVLMEWGDPREWPDVIAATRKKRVPGEGGERG